MKIEGILLAIPTLSREQRAGVRRNAEAATGDPSKEKAAREVLAALDGQALIDIATASDRLRLIPTGKRVTDVFTHKKMLATEEQAVQALLDYPGSTAEFLSKEAGWSKTTWLKRFATLLKKREAGLSPVEADSASDDVFYASIVADLTADGHWTMKPEVVDAFAKLGVVRQTLVS